MCRSFYSTSTCVSPRRLCGLGFIPWDIPCCSQSATHAHRTRTCTRAAVNATPYPGRRHRWARYALAVTQTCMNHRRRRGYWTMRSRQLPAERLRMRRSGGQAQRSVSSVGGGRQRRIGGSSQPPVRCGSRMARACAGRRVSRRRRCFGPDDAGDSGCEFSAFPARSRWCSVGLVSL